MIYPDEYDLKIKGDKWKIQIRLPYVLNCRHMRTVEHLLRVIRASETPEVEQTMKEYIQTFLEDSLAALEFINMTYDENREFCTKVLKKT